MRVINKLMIVAIVACYVSCEDILEEDISNDNVTVISPQNNQEVISNVVNFQWNEVDGADDYRLQVFSSANQSVVLDSLVSHTSFTYAINPGSYQWRVRGENFAYKTPYSFPAAFSVTATEDLSNQQVVLNSPVNDFYTNTASLNLSWAGITNATSYSFELVNVTNGNNIVVPETNITNTNYSLNNTVISNDGQYKWSVKAKNSNNGTQTLSTSRNFYIDRTAPSNPQNTSPSNNAILADNQVITLQWTASTDSGIIASPLNYTIEIASDVAFSNLIYTQQNISNNSHQYTFTTTGDYYWRVKVTDRAGNNSNYSTYSKIVIQ